MPSQLILPKRAVLNAKALERAIQNGLTATAKAVKVGLALPAATWKHKPAITIGTPSPYEREIAVDDAVYAMLDKGTKPHDIAPKRGRVLRFRTPFRAKTVPNQLRSNVGSVGSAEVYARRVHHPGTKARNWIKVAKTKWDAQFATTMQRSIDSEFSG